MLIGAMAILLGLFTFLKPDLVWRLTEQWKSYHADEPSDWYLINTRIGGAVFALLGIALIVLTVVTE